MSETAASLERDMIAQPELWRLVMLPGPRRLDVALLPPVESESMVFRSLLLDPEAESAAKALEDAIYANPLLLSDFRSVSCLIDTPQALIVPTDVDPSDHEMLLSRAFLTDEANPLTSATGDHDACIVADFDAEQRGFLTRSFYNISFSHHLAPLCRHLIEATDPDSDDFAVYAFRRHERLDVIALKGRHLLSANTFESTVTADAAYYILATAGILEMTVPHIWIGGDQTAASALIDELSRFAGIEVRQQPLPAMLFKPPVNTTDFPIQLILNNDANNKR